MKSTANDAVQQLINRIMCRKLNLKRFSYSKFYEREPRTPRPTRGGDGWGGEDGGGEPYETGDTGGNWAGEGEGNADAGVDGEDAGEWEATGDGGGDAYAEGEGEGYYQEGEGYGEGDEYYQEDGEYGGDGGGEYEEEE